MNGQKSLHVVGSMPLPSSVELHLITKEIGGPIRAMVLAHKLTETEIGS